MCTPEFKVPCSLVIPDVNDSPIANSSCTSLINLGLNLGLFL